MVEKFNDYICKYVQTQTGMLKRYLLAALDSQVQYLSYLDISVGTPVPSVDIRNCEFLVDAGLFREEVKNTRDGRNSYKLFYLTDLGREMVQEIKEEGYSDDMPQTPPMS